MRHKKKSSFLLSFALLHSGHNLATLLNTAIVLTLLICMICFKKSAWGEKFDKKKKEKEKNPNSLPLFLYQLISNNIKVFG